MGISSRRARITGLLVLGIVTGGAAEAAERLHMPFDCRFDGARVHLRPSDERTYEVFGRHQREIFTACSPDDPRRCRNWFVYRFDFDCGGARVAWLDAAAAATRFADWDAWAEDGRFAMRMGPDWGVARERPHFARRRFLRRRHRERVDAFEAEAENPLFAPRIVTAPPGYAPAVGIPLTFSGAGSRDLAQQPAAPPAVAAYVEEEPAHPAIPALPVRAPRQDPTPAQASPPLAATPDPVPAPVATAAPAPEATPPSPNESPSGRANAPGVTPPVAATSSQPGSKTGSSSGGFTIINAPRPAAAAPEPQPPPPAAPAPIATGAVTTPSAGSPEPTIAETKAITETEPVRPQPPPAAPAEPSPLPAADGPRFEIIPVATATALLLAVLSVLGFWYWRRAPAPAPLPAARDFGAISLDGGPQATALALESAGAAGLEVPRAPDQSAEGSAAIDELPVPTTYTQALDILGASPDSSVAAIKKIVDGLRQSWHPDLARSEADRAHRERRVQQINVAWDLVSQRRSAA